MYAAAATAAVFLPKNANEDLCLRKIQFEEDPGLQPALRMVKQAVWIQMGDADLGGAFSTHTRISMMGAVVAALPLILQRAEREKSKERKSLQKEEKRIVIAQSLQILMRVIHELNYLINRVGQKCGT